MMDGFYTVHFETANGSGAGVVILRSGDVRGGDSSFYFTGTFAEDGEKMSATIKVARHSAGLTSVFGALDLVNLTSKGVIRGDSFFGKAIAAEVPGLPMNFTLRRIGD